ncbi:DUF3987 domain-containing protein [Paracraurococcus ruber]|uniref:DUF3987 domain-containing protein n=1 Tax=Paracraurococcus ruber TaxID=77675 RepID=A0ABS1D2H5_9PROT|nr:DUF3987 domain-containing protein [Paracraurococcus ruber]MBK1660751.1 hypothetical protein [Paracraurococcus ruber]TDG27148.1 DUF3987 domain-containing protein [Paracraurococcus ruber]
MSKPAEKWSDEITPAYAVPMTFFTSVEDTGALERTVTMEALVREIRNKSARKKEALPLGKLARFGDKLSPKGKMRRWNSNMVEIHGVELDYDAEVMAFDDAVEILSRANVGCIAYTTPSHTPDKPRWRVLCPTSRPLPPSEREPLVERVHGLFGGIFGRESFVQSQAFYYGSVNFSEHHQVEFIAGRPIDLCAELEECRIGKRTNPDGKGETPNSEEAACNIIRRMDHGVHDACVYLGSVWSLRGIPRDEAKARVDALLHEVPGEKRDKRWDERVAESGRAVDFAYDKDDANPESRKPRGKNGEEEEWPEPVDFLGDRTPRIIELAPDHVPDVLWPFITDISERVGADPTMVALCALVSLSGAIHDKWVLQPKRYDYSWTVSARLWGTIIGDPSVKKSPAIKDATAPLVGLELASADRNREDMLAYERDLARWKKDSNADPERMPTPPRRDRYLIGSTTVEALEETFRDDIQSRQRVPAMKVTVVRDELSGWLGDMDKYSAGKGGSDRAAWLELYDGAPHYVDRVGRGSFTIGHFSANLLGGIQPSMIRDAAQKSQDDGLWQRFIYCAARRATSGEDRAPNRTALLQYNALFKKLADTPPPEAFGDMGQAVKLHEDGQRYRENLDKLVEGFQLMPDTPPLIMTALGKWPGLFGRLLLTFHMIEYAASAELSPPMVVSPETCRRVASYMRDILLPHLAQANAIMFRSNQESMSQQMGAFILAKGGERLTLRDVQRGGPAPLRAPTERRALLEILTWLEDSMGWLRAVPVRPGKEPNAWDINPKVHARFAQRADDERAERERRHQAALAALDASKRGV